MQIGLTLHRNLGIMTVLDRRDSPPICFRAREDTGQAVALRSSLRLAHIRFWDRPQRDFRRCQGQPFEADMRDCMGSDRFTMGGQALVSKVKPSGDLKLSIEQAVTAIGGFERLVEPGDTILVKPNFNTADPVPAASDPQFVRAIIELLYEQGAHKVVLGESSTISVSTRDTLERTGMLQAATETGAVVTVFDEEDWVTVETGGEFLKRVAVARAALEADKIVYACCLKTHRFADFTMSLKLAMGFVRPQDRLKMHLWRLREKLVDLNLILKPDLILMDARLCFISGGPSKGTIREPGLVLASGDRLGIDVEGIKIIQSYPDHTMCQSPWEVPMIQRAADLRLGATNEQDYQIIHSENAGR